MAVPDTPKDSHGFPQPPIDTDTLTTVRSIVYKYLMNHLSDDYDGAKFPKHSYIYVTSFKRMDDAWEAYALSEDRPDLLFYLYKDVKTNGPFIYFATYEIKDVDGEPDPYLLNSDGQLSFFAH